MPTKLGNEKKAERETRYAREQCKIANERFALQMENRELRELVYAALGELIDRIEICGASEKLTHAVVLACDLRRAIGNGQYKPDEYAKLRVMDILPNAK